MRPRHMRSAAPRPSIARSSSEVGPRPDDRSAQVGRWTRSADPDRVVPPEDLGWPDHESDGASRLGDPRVTDRAAGDFQGGGHGPTPEHVNPVQQVQAERRTARVGPVAYSEARAKLHPLASRELERNVRVAEAGP